MLDIFKIKKLSHLSLKDKTGLNLYPWKNCRPTSVAPITKPLSESKAAIISSAGIYLKDSQEKFDPKIRGGDYSYREILSNSHVNQMKEGHRSRSFDHTGLRTDPTSGLPLPQMAELAREGFIGQLNHRHFSLMGSILTPKRFIKNTIPEIVNKLRSDAVDVVLLIPV